MRMVGGWFVVEEVGRCRHCLLCEVLLGEMILPCEIPLCFK